MAKISQYFKDKAKTIKDYPKTLMKAVYGDDGKRLDNIIRDITSDIDSTKAKIGTTDISAIGDGTVTGGLSILSNNAYDLKMLGWTVPKECPVQNYVDEDGVFHQIVGRVDLSKLMWEWADTLNEFRTDLYIMGMNPYSTNIYCSKYKFGSEMYLSGMGIYIKDPNYDSSTISQFKADKKGVYFYYELATEITKPVDGNEVIKLLNDKLGNTDISAIGDGTVTGGLDALNSNLQKQVIITQSITIETTIEPYKMIVSRFCIRPLIPYVLLSAIHPSSGTKTQFFINDSGDLYATAEGVQSVGDWVINGSYIAK